MKKILGLLFAASLGVAAFAQKGSMAIGTAMPESGYQTSDVLHGKAVGLKELKTEKGLLVIFTCNTCPFVIKNIDRTQEVLQAARANGLGVMLVNSNEAQRADADAPEAMVAFGKKQGYPNYCVDQGSALANIFGASHTPEVFLFDGKTGALVYKGAMDDNPGDPKSAKTMYLQQAIENLVSGKAISPQETKSLGCSIKRVKS